MEIFKEVAILSGIGAVSGIVYGLLTSEPDFDECVVTTVPCLTYLDKKHELGWKLDEMKSKPSIWMLSMGLATFIGIRFGRTFRAEYSKQDVDDAKYWIHQVAEAQKAIIASQKIEKEEEKED